MWSQHVEGCDNYWGAILQWVRRGALSVVLHDAEGEGDEAGALGFEEAEDLGAGYIKSPRGIRREHDIEIGEKREDCGDGSTKAEIDGSESSLNEKRAQDREVKDVSGSIVSVQHEIRITDILREIIKPWYEGVAAKVSRMEPISSLTEL